MKKVKLPRLLSNTMKEQERLHPSEASVTFNLYTPHAASLVLPEGEPDVKLHDWVQLYTINGSAGIFRMTGTSGDVGTENRLTLRHGICIAADDVVRLPEDEISGTVGELFTRFWASDGVTKAPQFWRLGSMAQTPVIKYQPSGHTLLQAMQSTIKKARGYALSFDQSVFPWVLNVVKLDDGNPCEGRFSRNLDGVTIEVDDSEQCTRVYLDDRDGYTDADNIGTWGVISKELNVPENATDESIAAYVADYLDTHKNPTVSIEASGADLSAITGESVDALTLGRMCRACLVQYKTIIEERIVCVDVPDVYGDPHGVTISMSNKVETASDLLVLVERETQSLNAASVRAGRRAGGMQKEIDQTYLELVATAEELVRYQDTTQTRFNEVAVILDAVNAQLLLKASQATVDDIRQRMSYAGITLDGSAASVKALAYQETVEGVNSRVSEAFIEINGAKSDILLKADTVTVDAITTRLNNVLAGSVKATLLRTANITADGANIGGMSFDGSYVGKDEITVMTGHSIKLTKAQVTINGIIYNFVTGVVLSKDTETIKYLSY